MSVVASVRRALVDDAFRYRGTEGRRGFVRRRLSYLGLLMIVVLPLSFAREALLPGVVLTVEMGPGAEPVSEIATNGIDGLERRPITQAELTWRTRLVDAAGWLVLVAKLGVGAAYTVPLEVRRWRETEFPMAGYAVGLAAILTASFRGELIVTVLLSALLFAMLALWPARN